MPSFSQMVVSVYLCRSLSTTLQQAEAEGMIDDDVYVQPAFFFFPTTVFFFLTYVAR